MKTSKYYFGIWCNKTTYTNFFTC